MNIKDCLPDGAGTCRNEAMIEELQAANAHLKARNAELLYDVARLFKHRATLVRYVRELREANADLMAVNDQEIKELRSLIDVADGEWKKFVAMTHDEQIHELEENIADAVADAERFKADNARLRESLWTVGHEASRLREALESVEWTCEFEFDREDPEEAYYFSYTWCPWCKQEHDKGHAHDCQRQQALERTP